mmetsp:Transcript_25232/g.60680  ORF Transcript_25232/g.60680 Transcript_25232/m.60680 type:complete len:386 (-) Transcript_25232:194-1351(-)
MIPHEPLAPEVGPPIREEYERVKVCQEPRALDRRKVQDVSILQPFVVYAQLGPIREHLPHALLHRRVHGGGLTDEVLLRRSLPPILLRHHFRVGMPQLCDGLATSRGRECCRALNRIPSRIHAHPVEVAFHGRRRMPADVGPYLRLARLRIRQLSSLSQPMEELLRRDYVEALVLDCDAVQVKEVAKVEVALLLLVALAQQVESLFRRQNQCSAHCVRHYQCSFHCHSYVIPPSMIGFERQEALFGIVHERALIPRIARYVRPERHLPLRELVVWPAVLFLASQSRQFVLLSSSLTSARDPSFHRAVVSIVIQTGRRFARVVRQLHPLDIIATGAESLQKLPMRLYQNVLVVKYVVELNVDRGDHERERGEGEEEAVRLRLPLLV